LKLGKSEANVDDLYEALGQDHHFDNTVTKMMLEILSVRLRSSGNTCENGKNRRKQIQRTRDGDGYILINNLSEAVWTNGRYPTENHAAEDLAPEDAAPEDATPDEAAASSLSQYLVARSW
jgi:hypothetical protein